MWFLDVAPDVCPDGWVKWSNNCYKFVYQLATFASAKVNCKQTSAQLVSVHSWEENKFVRE